MRRLTPHPGRGRAPGRDHVRHIGPARYRVGGGELLQKGSEGIGSHFLHGYVDKAFVSREIQISHGPWGHLIGGGRADAGGGHRVVRLRRLTGSIVIGHGRSFGPFKGCRPFIDVFDRCGSILRLLTGDSTSVVDRRRRDENPAPNTHTVAWWHDEWSLKCLSRWWKTIEATRCAPPIDHGGS